MVDALLVSLPWVGALVYVLWVLRDRDDAHRRERTAQMNERAFLLNRLADLATSHREEIAQLHLSHRQEIAALNQARIEETASLLQRIQAPEQAVVSHVAHTAPPDPPPVDLGSDEELFNLAERRMQEFGTLNG